ncbi:MAG: HipA N-terminal domain-containing protein [Gammaproteobacteria bacterium]|nr:HipA N-terminal domain-containing protein [Gammaproteobacteria bacterium]
MKKARVKVSGIEAGILEKSDHTYRFIYDPDYAGSPVSLTMPLSKKIYEFDQFPSFFEGLLPEGVMLEALLKKYKLDKNDFLGQLLAVGHDVVGNVTIEAAE